jgi:enoyl-CoA hydratase
MQITSERTGKVALIAMDDGMTLTPWALEPLSHRLSKQHWIPSIVQARVHDPDGALEAGFLDEVVDDGQAVDRAMAIAKELAQLPAQAYAANKLMTRAESIDIARADVARL